MGLSGAQIHTEAGGKFWEVSAQVYLLNKVTRNGTEFVPGDGSDGARAWSRAGDRRPCVGHLRAGGDVGVGARGKAGEKVRREWSRR